MALGVGLFYVGTQLRDPVPISVSPVASIAGKMAFMRKVVCMILALSLGVAARAAQRSPTVKPQVATLLAGLHAAKWSDRAIAYEQLRDDPAALRLPEVKSALLDLEDRENRLDWSKEPGFNPEESESRGEYRAELGDTVDSLADWNDPRQLCILAHTAYNIDSAFARRLAMAGPAVIPCLMQMAQSTSFNDRYKEVSRLSAGFCPWRGLSGWRLAPRAPALAGIPGPCGA